MLFLELELDQDAFSKYFRVIGHDEFRSRDGLVELLDGEVALPSVRVTDLSICDHIRAGLVQYEHYLKQEFGQKVSLNFLVYERTSLLHQLKLKLDHEQVPMIELWCARDQPELKRIRFSCRTLYTICLKKNSPEKLERETHLDYLKIWTYFGLNKLDLTRTQLHFVSYLYLKTLFLYLPTMELNRGDDEDSENEEQALIANKPIDCVCAVRNIITVKGRRVPATVSLVGIGNKSYLGIKVTVLDPETVSEQGFFLTVD